MICALCTHTESFQVKILKIQSQLEKIQSQILQITDQNTDIEYCIKVQTL